MIGNARTERGDGLTSGALLTKEDVSDGWSEVEWAAEHTVTRYNKSGERQTWDR